MSPGPREVSGSHARRRHAFRLYLLTALVAMFAVIAADGVLETFTIESRSMEPTVEVGDRLLGYLIAVFRADTRVGDLVTFTPPPGVDSKIPLIKRVVALPGDVVWITRGKLCVNGEVRHELYTAAGPMAYTLPPYRVPPDHVFVLGDNRNLSEDSSVFGALPASTLGHEILLRYAPWDRRCSFGPPLPGFGRCRSQPRP